MKTLIILLALLVGLPVWAQIPPPLPASQAETIAGTVKNKYISPYTLATAGITGNTNALTPEQATKLAQSAATNATGVNMSGAFTGTFLGGAGTFSSATLSSNIFWPDYLGDPVTIYPDGAGGLYVTTAGAVTFNGTIVAPTINSPAMNIGQLNVTNASGNGGGFTNLSPTGFNLSSAISRPTNYISGVHLPFAACSNGDWYPLGTVGATNQYLSFTMTNVP